VTRIISEHILNNQPCCPVCFKTLEGATNIHGPDAPAEGDACLCVYCGELLAFTEHRYLVVATAEHIERWKQVPAAWAAIQRIREIVKKRQELL
jgi:hypothetical protein